MIPIASMPVLRTAAFYQSFGGESINKSAWPGQVVRVAIYIYVAQMLEGGSLMSVHHSNVIVSSK